MEELIELRHYIENEEYDKALLLIDELEEMSLEDKLNKIFSYTVILLVHLIKQEAEKRTTKSWEVSIANSLKQIERTNKRRKSGGFYASLEDLSEIIDEAYPLALKKASLEVMGGIRTAEELEKMVEGDRVKQRAIQQITADSR